MKGILSILALGVLASPPLIADSSSARAVDPVALLREAENHPALRAAQARSEAARHVAARVMAPQDPEVSLAYTNDTLSSFTLGESEFSNLALTWSQEVRRSGKRRLAGEVASRSVETAAQVASRVRLQVLSEVKIAYADLLRVDRTAALLAELHTVLDALEQTARRRYEVGEGIQESILKAQTRLLLLEADRKRLELERTAIEARLEAAAGRSDPAPLGPAQIPLEGGLPEDSSWVDQALAEASPEIGEKVSEVARAEAQAQLARWEQKPDYRWTASYQYRGDLDPMVMGMFGIRLPLYKDRKQAQAVAESESDLQAAKADLDALRVKRRSELLEQMAEVQRSETLLALYREGIVPRAQTTFESGRASYAAGRLGLADLLSDLEALLQARKEEVALETQRIQALAALEPMAGRELVRVAEVPAASGGDHATLH